MYYFKLCDDAHNIAKEIMDSNEFKELMNVKAEINKNIPNLLEKFKIAKDKYALVSKYGNYHPDYKKALIELKEVKEELYTNPLVIKYKELEKKIQEKLNEVANELSEVLKGADSL